MNENQQLSEELQPVIASPVIGQAATEIEPTSLSDHVNTFQPERTQTQAAAPLPKWRYVFTVISILQLSALAIIAYYVIAAGFWGILFIFIFIFLPYVCGLAFVNLIGLSYYFAKYKVRCGFLAVSWVVSAIIVAAAGIILCAIYLTSGLSGI